METLPKRYWIGIDKILIFFTCLLILMIIGAFFSFYGITDTFLYNLGVVVSFFTVPIVFFLILIKKVGGLSEIFPRIYKKRVRILVILTLFLILSMLLHLAADDPFLEYIGYLTQYQLPFVILTFSLVIVPVFNKLSEFTWFQSIYPSENQYFQRFFVAAFFALSFSPLVLALYPQINKFIVVDIITTYFLLIWAIFMLISYIRQKLKKFSFDKQDKKNLQDIIRSNYFLLASTVILILNLGIALEINPAFLSLQIPGIEYIYEEAIQGTLIWVFGLNTGYICIFMVIIGPLGLNILKDLSLTQESKIHPLLAKLIGYEQDQFLIKLLRLIEILVYLEISFIVINLSNFLNLGSFAFAISHKM